MRSKQYAKLRSFDVCCSSHSRSNRARKDKEHRSSSNRRNDQWEDDYSGRVSDRKPNRSHDRRVDVASDRHNPSAARSPRKAASETLTSAGHDVSSRSERGQKSPAVARTSRSPSSGASRSPLDLGTARHSSLLADAARLVKERERQRMAQELLTSSKAAAAHKSSTGTVYYILCSPDAMHQKFSHLFAQMLICKLSILGT
jgi:hypothetical protein